MEAALAAYGSGSARASLDTGRRILNIDIGGGTTKLSILAAGDVTATAALEVGGRLVAADADGRIVRLEEAGRQHARAAGVELRLGARVSSAELDAVAAEMADVLAAALAPDADAARLPYLTEPIGPLTDVTGVIFSGGVAEYVYGNETRDFGDLGRRLGLAMAGAGGPLNPVSAPPGRGANPGNRARRVGVQPATEWPHLLRRRRRGAAAPPQRPGTAPGL